MDLMRAQQVAKEIMGEWLGTGWKFEFNNASFSFGTTSVKGNTRKIKMSRKLTELNNEDRFIRTLKHEIGHAMEYELYGNLSHSIYWKILCREIGLDNPERCYSIANTVIPPRKFKGTCQKCGTIYKRDKRAGRCRCYGEIKWERI
jgi:predicted SprT family Zn-dependent metalloprotease